MAQINVAVGILLNKNKQVLTSWRQPHQHQGGLWEFPGGKQESDETHFDALKREIKEEIGVQIVTAEPFIRIDHNYGDKRVSLDVWLVTEFVGEPHGLEGQPLRWQSIAELDVNAFPAGNMGIIEALQRISV